MTIAEFKTYFKTELSDLYTDSECTFLSAIFIEKIVGFSTFDQRKFSTQELLIDDLEQLKKITSELIKGKPYQQILGETEFYGMKFFVNDNVLIPRPETEELLEIAIDEIKKYEKQKINLYLRNSESDDNWAEEARQPFQKKESFKNLKILDIGTGSGIIPLVLKKYFPAIEITSIDFSDKALEIAKKNAAFHDLDINFIHGDYLDFNLNEIFDIIISNPPYIGIEEENEIADSVKEFEPKMALFSPTFDALIFYRKIAEDSKKYLNKNGLLFLEINQKLGKETLELYRKDFSNIHLMKDLSQNDRFIFGTK